jgi:hypothetical protein
MDAIQTDAQINAAFHARLAAAGLAAQRPEFTAIMAMPRHSFDFSFSQPERQCFSPLALKHTGGLNSPASTNENQ